MEEKRISYSQFQQVKACAKMIDPCLTKIAALKKKIMPLVEEMKGYQIQIDALEQGIVSVLGFHVEELVKKVIEPTGKTDANGKPIKTTKYLPTDIVSYDEQKKQFVISAEPAISATDNVAGSDFGDDKENFQEEVNVPEEAVAEAGDMPWNE